MSGINRVLVYSGHHPIVTPKAVYRGSSYISKHRQQLYEIVLRLASDPTSELFHRSSTDGKLYRRSGASVRSAFWAGYDEALTGIHNKLRRGAPDSDASTCYRAGLDFGRADKREIARRAE